MNLTPSDIDVLEEWWIQKSRVNFLAYRKYMRADTYIDGWFLTDLAQHFQQFYMDLRAGLRPILLVQSPPQHGKSWAVTDFLAWVSGQWPEVRSIYASYSDTLGVRCNTQLQRFFDTEKHQKIFPDMRVSKNNVVTISDKARRNSRQIEFVGSDGAPTGGQFRNTTTGGPVTGESLDLGVIDDAVKGREQANSKTWSEKIWEWFTDDFNTRFSDKAGLLIITTRWTIHDIIARLVKIKDQLKGELKLINYQAIATKDEKYRKEGKPLFPELKSLEFLDGKKALMGAASWEALYQGNPVITGGNLFKDEWWGWWEALPQIKYKFITADTAQKIKTQNDWTIFQCWGYGIDDRIYLLDKIRYKFEAPELRKEAEMFYRKHDTRRINLTDPILRGMYIEDKSSGTGLLQELGRKRLKVIEVPRHTDKYFRAEDALPYIEAGKVVLNAKISDVGNLTKEGREFPNGDFDDDIDTLMTAVEVAFINQDKSNLLQAAMEAD